MLLAGFGALVCLWFTGIWRGGHRGLFDYRAATWGDALLLPGVTALLIKTLDDPRLRRPAHENAITATVCAAGGLAGAVVQATWLLDSKPSVNWTLPHPHVFSVPGWYHASFFVVMSAVLAGLTIRLVRRLRATGPVSGSAIRLGAIAGCYLAFGFLVTLDNIESTNTLASGSTLVALTAVLLILVLLVGYGVVWRAGALARALGIAVAIAAAVTAASLITHPLS